MANFKTKSGADVVLNVAPFQDALTLNNILGNPVLSLRTDIDPSFNLDAAVNGHIMVMLGSKPDVQAHIMKCLIRSTYNGQKITWATFEAAETREDFFEVAAAAIKENIAPFVASLYSQFSALVEAMPKKPAVTPPSP